MRKAAPRIFVIACLSLLALPSLALARPWAGSDYNDLGPASVLLATQNGKVKVRNLQMILACTDTQDGTESSRAFWARYLTYEPLRLNRFDLRFTAYAGGRIGLVRLKGRLGSNGRGAARATVEAVANSDEGAVIERCGGSVRIPVRRGPG
jgi:hypothetical protein